MAATKKTARKKRKKKATKKVSVESYRHESATRKNIPTAKIAAEGIVPRVAKEKYSYNAHLSPALRFDVSGQNDRVSEIVEKSVAGKKLTKDESDILRGIAANASQPWLEWSGKKEEHDRGALEVEPVALHIHERVSANAIIRAAKRQDVQADLFADPKQEYKEAIQFYKHDVDWTNRLVLGDALEVMSSLSKREGMAGKVQMVYIDPPYGIRFGSNFQSDVGKTAVKDTDVDLSREPETVRAYRDTWRLGLHSYLSYLRDRLIVARELLSVSGSIFVQIGDENVANVRLILEEIFGKENFVGAITVQKTGGLVSHGLIKTLDYVLWFCRDKSQLKARTLYLQRQEGEKSLTRYDLRQSEDGALTAMSINNAPLGDKEERVQLAPLYSGGAQKNPPIFQFQDKEFRIRPEANWKTTESGLYRLAAADRVAIQGKMVRYKRFASDFPVVPLTDRWESVQIGTQRIYVVQTATKVIERCMLMTTDPGDLVIDPTCGSGTTAYVAEEWGRRWITIDTSRVALSLARQRLITAKFPFYSINSTHDGEHEPGVDPATGFIYQKAPHIRLSDIANNENLDSIVDKHQTTLDACLADCNAAISSVTDELRKKLVGRLGKYGQENGIRSITDIEVRRYLLPGTSYQHIQDGFSAYSKLKRSHADKYSKLVPLSTSYSHWNVPFDSDPDWPNELTQAVEAYRRAWRERMREINECIVENADYESLVDRPDVDTNTVRVSGPFTVEGIRPEELSLDENGELFDPTPNDWEVNDGQGSYSQNASAYLDRMLQLLSHDGVTFPNNEFRKFERIERLEESDSALHAEALWKGADDGDAPNVAIAFGPQHGPVTASQVEDLIRASRRYDELVIAAFSFDGSSQAVIQESANPRLKIHMAHIRPDVSPGMDGLLKDSPKSQLFTVFGQPEIKLHEEDGEIKVELLGVDIYSPLTGEITSSGANKVAAWFLDSDYDGRCFCITQAFFPNQKAWDKIAKALGSSADVEAFEAYNGTVSVPFELGEHQRIAVKVIDPRGNEVMAIRSLEDAN